MSKELLELIAANPDLPVYAWVNADVVRDGYGYWVGEMHTASIQEYAEVEPYGYSEQTWVIKGDDEDYYDYLVNSDEYAGLTDEEAKQKAEETIANLPWKKAIFVWVGTI